MILRKNLPDIIFKLLEMGKVYEIPFGFTLESSLPLPKNVVCWVILSRMRLTHLKDGSKVI